MDDVIEQSLSDIRQHIQENHSVCHQNEIVDEDSNTPEILMLVLDALGYSTDEVMCHQQFSIFKEKINKLFNIQKDVVLTGSISQGFANSLYYVSKLSDLDFVYINPYIKVMTNEEYSEYMQNPLLFRLTNATPIVCLVEEDGEYPGYVKLVDVMSVDNINPHSKQYYSSRDYRDQHRGKSALRGIDPIPVHQVSEDINGPAITTHYEYDYSGGLRELKEDCVPCLDYKTWPVAAQEWIKRPRPHNWPSKGRIQTIKQKGCYLAAVGHFDSESKDCQWRVSFKGEKLLFAELNRVQYYCFVVLRLILKGDIRHIDNDVLTSYHIKNVVYWCAERSSCMWIMSNFENCLKECIHKFEEFITTRKFPSYFVVGRNLLNSKMTADLSSKILKLLQKYSSNIYEVLSLDTLSLLRNSTLYKPAALKLAIQKSVVHACIKAYGVTLCDVAKSPFKIWNTCAILSELECLEKLNQINHALESEKQHYFDYHLIRSYIHNILGFLNYACYEKFGQSYYLPAASKHLMKSISFPNIVLMCRAATLLFMKLDFENCLKICKVLFNYPEPSQSEYETHYELSNNANQISYNIIDKSDITSMNAQRKQLMSLFVCTEEPNCEFEDCKSNIMPIIKNLTYVYFKETFRVVYTRVESKALPEVLQYEFEFLSKSDKEYYYGICLSPFLNCCLLSFLCYHKTENFDLRDEELRKMDEYYYIKCKTRENGHSDRNLESPLDTEPQESLHRIANISAYCYLKAKHYKKASKLILESMEQLPSRSNVAYGYIKCIIYMLH